MLLTNKQPVLYFSAPRSMLLLASFTETNSRPSSQSTNVFQTLVYRTPLLRLMLLANLPHLKFPRPWVSLIRLSPCSFLPGFLLHLLRLLIKCGCSSGPILALFSFAFCWDIPIHISRYACLVDGRSYSTTCF